MLEAYEFICTIIFYKDEMILFKSLNYFKEVSLSHIFKLRFLKRIFWIKIKIYNYLKSY
jgi:hypothetical protein